MGYRRSATHQAVDNNPNKKHRSTGRGTNPAFVAGSTMTRDSNGGMGTMRFPVATKPAKNKAAK